MASEMHCPELFFIEHARCPNLRLPYITTPGSYGCRHVDLSQVCTLWALVPSPMATAATTVLLFPGPRNLIDALYLFRSLPSLDHYHHLIFLVR